MTWTGWVWAGIPLERHPGSGYAQVRGGRMGGDASLGGMSGSEQAL